MTFWKNVKPVFSRIFLLRWIFRDSIVSMSEWLLDVPLSIQVFMEAFLNKDSFKQAVNANHLLQSKLEKLYLTYDTLLNTYNKKYFGILQEANTKELVMNFQNVNSVFTITSGSGVTMSLHAAEKKLKSLAADDLRYYNTFLKRHPFNYITQNGESESLVSLRECYLILMMDNLVRLKTREDSIRCRGDARTHQLCTLPITIQGIPKDSKEVKEWHDHTICDGSSKCRCKETVKLPGDTVKEVLIDLNENEQTAMELFQSLCTWGHPQIWKDIQNTEISKHLRGRSACSNPDVRQTDEEVEVEDIGVEVEKEHDVPSAISQTDEDMPLQSTDKDDASPEEDNSSLSDESENDIEDEEDASEEEITDENNVDLVDILKCGVEEIDIFPDEELFTHEMNYVDHDISVELPNDNISMLEQSLHNLSIDSEGSNFHVNSSAVGNIMQGPSKDNSGICSSGITPAVTPHDKCNEGFTVGVHESLLETSLKDSSMYEETDRPEEHYDHNNHTNWAPSNQIDTRLLDTISEQELKTSSVEKDESSESGISNEIPNFLGIQPISDSCSISTDHFTEVPSEQQPNDVSSMYDNSSDQNQSLPIKFGFLKKNCSTLLSRHPPPAIGQDNDINVLQRVLDDVLVKSGYQDKTLTTKEDKILFGPDNKIGSNLIELMKRKKKYDLFLPEFPLLHLRKSKITTLISSYKNAGLTQLLRYMLDDEKKEWAKLVDPTDIDIATTKIFRVSKAIHLALLVRFIQTLDEEEATSLIGSLQTQEPESTASRWNTRYQHFLTECSKRNATFELHVDIMRHCDEVIAIKLAERLGGESGYHLLLAATKSSLIFAFLNGASYYAPFCTQLLLHHYSTGPFYRNMKYNLFSTPSSQSNLNMSGDTKREMDHRDVLKGFRTGSTLSAVTWRMALIDPLNEVQRIRRQKTTEEETSVVDDLGWKTTTNDLTYVIPLAELILNKGGLSFEENLVPFNVYASQEVALQSSMLDSLTSSVGQFLLERYIRKENLADLRTELVGSNTMDGPKDLVSRAVRSKGTTMKRATKKVAVIPKTARDVTEEKRKKKLTKTIKQAQHLSSAMNTCQALVKPDCSKPKVSKSSGMPRALVKVLSMTPSSLNTTEVNQLVALNQKSIPDEITGTIRKATAEFAGVKYKVKADSGVAYLKCIENTVIQPIMHMLPELEQLVLCEEKYSYTPNDFKAYTREQRKKQNDNTISHLKTGSSIISDTVFCQSSAVETEEGKKLVSNYLAQNVHRLNIRKKFTLDIDSELHKDKDCQCQATDGACDCLTYTIPIRCSFSSQALESVEKLPDIKQRKGEAEMSQVDWLFNYQTSLEPGEAIASIVTSGDIDAIPIHLYALSRKWPKNEAGKYKHQVFVVLQKLGRRIDIYNITGILEHLERTYDNDLIGWKIALGLCLGGNDFIPKLHGHSHEKVLLQSLNEKFLDRLFVMTGPQLQVRIDVQTYIDFVKCLYCHCRKEDETKPFEQVRLATITRKKHPKKLTNDDARNAQLWMPPQTALVSVAGIVDLQIRYLETAGLNESVLPNFLQKGCLKKTESGDIEYDFGPDVYVKSIECLQQDTEMEDKTPVKKRQPKPPVKRRQEQTNTETPRKGYRRKRQMTSTPAKR